MDTGENSIFLQKDAQIKVNKTRNMPNHPKRRDNFKENNSTHTSDTDLIL